MVSVPRLACFLSLVATPLFATDETNSVTSPANATSTAELIKSADQDLTDGKTDQAESEVNLAVQLDPKNAEAYALRSSIYTRIKLWDRAERDAATADKIAPDPAYKYKMGEIKFLQKAYDDARPHFAGLQNDPTLGDLAVYKVFMCDLFGGHESFAARDLATEQKSYDHPSYYFSQIAWCLFHGQRSQANSWFAQVKEHVNENTSSLYLESYNSVQRFQAQTASFETKDGQKFEKALVSLETYGLRVNTAKGWITLPLDQLPGDLSSFPPEIGDQIRRRRAISKADEAQQSRISFTTTAGKSYDNLRWSIHNDGLSVLTPEGWVTVPFGQLPADLSSFPPDAQNVIEEKRKSFSGANSADNVASFTTRSGKSYDQVKMALRPDGVAVLTADGLHTISFRDLPTDLSAFPIDWRPSIKAGRNASESSDMARVTFVTRSGQHYDDVRASLQSTGLRVLTPQGLAEVPFSDIPKDLSPFPITWCPMIKAQHESSKSDASGIKVAATSDLYPPSARDCNFGSCLALEGALMVVGSNGAAYVFANDRLVARLCSYPDVTGTGDNVTSVALSGQTIVTGTPRGLFVWVELLSGWDLETALTLPGPATTVSVDGDNIVAAIDGKGDAENSLYYFARQNGVWSPVPRTSQQERETPSSDRFGGIAALHGPDALVGVPDWSKASYMKGTAAESGCAYLEHFDGTAWAQELVLKPENAPTGANQFGASVALSEHFAAISSTNHDAIDYAQHHGSVYLFRRTYDGWKKEAVLHGPDPTGDTGFGSAPIALSNDTLAVADACAKVHRDKVVLDSGEKTQKGGFIQNVGAVYLFNGQTLETTLTAPDPTDGLDRLGSRDRFATSLALDGNTIGVGAPGKNGGMGSVYIWKRRKGSWELEKQIKGFHQQGNFDY